MRMTDLNNTLPPALGRALELLADPPAIPDVSKGYLDLLGARSVEDPALPKNTGVIQAVWASPVGSRLYDNAQAALRRLFTGWLQPAEWLHIPPGGTALDVGCGPGTVTASLAATAGPGEVVLGIDISEPMLTRAVRAEARPQVGFLRADAQRLPLRDETVDAVLSIAMLQLIPDPVTAVRRWRGCCDPADDWPRWYPPPGVPPGFGGCCRTSGLMCSAKTNSPASSKTTALSVCGPRISALFSGGAAHAGETARDDYTTGDVLVRIVSPRINEPAPCSGHTERAGTARNVSLVYSGPQGVCEDGMRWRVQ
jgi:arsenite methyltransferase